MILLAPTMDGLAALITTGPPAMDNVYPWPTEEISVPCAVVGFPESIVFDAVYGDGANEFHIPIWHVIAKTGDQQARDRLSVALTGVSSIKKMLDGIRTFGGQSCTVRVTDAAIAEIAVGGIAYVAIKLSTEVVG